MAQTVNTANLGTIKPAQEYINEGDAISGDLEKLALLIEERGVTVARMESSLRSHNKMWSDRRSTILSRFTNPESSDFQKTLAAQERAAKVAYDADEDLVMIDQEITRIQEIRDLTEAELSAAKKRHSGLTARQLQIANIIHLRASQLDYTRTRNFGAGKTVNINI